MTRLNQYALFPISQPNSAFLVKALLRTIWPEEVGALAFPPVVSYTLVCMLRAFREVHHSFIWDVRKNTADVT